MELLDNRFTNFKMVMMNGDNVHINLNCTNPVVSHKSQQCDANHFNLCSGQGGEVKKDDNKMTDHINDKDVDRAASILAFEFRHFCINCHTFTTPQWRLGWYDPKTRKNVDLCNACGLKYAKGQQCPKCKFIYNAESCKTKFGSKRITCANCNFQFEHLIKSTMYTC